MKTHFQNIPKPERTHFRILAVRRLNEIQHIDLKYKKILTGWTADVGKDELVIRDQVRFRFHVSNEQWVTLTVSDRWAEDLIKRLKNDK